MRVSAYVLAADPTWIDRSVTSYYDDIDSLVVSFDADHRGWTGVPVDVPSCLARLRALDRAAKIVELTGNFHENPDRPLESETAQRTLAVTALKASSDWVLQLDTDEYLPPSAPWRQALEVAQDESCSAVEWPMRVLYRHLVGRTYLQVTNSDGTPHYEYPGPVAVRSTADLSVARRTAARVLRVVVRGDDRSAKDATGPVWEIEPLHAIWHNSWARSPASVLSKIRSWGHSDGRRIYRYYATTWLPSPVLWPVMRDLHPFSWGRWDRVTPVTLPRGPVL